MRNKIALFKSLAIAQGIVLAVMFSLSVHAQSSIHDRWAKHDETSKKVVDHQAMDNILTFIAIPQDNTRYNLRGLNSRVIQYITDYKTFLQTVPVSQLNKNEQLAFWLNLYNAAVIEKMTANISDSGKLKKLRGVPGDAGKWWSDKNIEVEGVLLSLEDIEQQVLAKQWQDPLFIYGLFYGVNGDGFSTSVAFTGSNVERQLKTMAKAFINDRANLKIKRGQARVSSLIAWNKEAVFNNSDEAILEHLRTYANAKTAKRLEGISEISKKHSFSWKTAVYSPPPVNRNSYATSGGAGLGGGGGYRGGS